MKLCLAVSYDLCVSRPAGEAQQALELSIYILSHSASTQEAKDRAGQLRAEPEARLALEQIAVARGRAQTKTFDALVAERQDHRALRTRSLKPEPGVPLTPVA